MIPPRRLTTLLEQARSYQKSTSPYYVRAGQGSAGILSDIVSDRQAFPSRCTNVLRDHEDEIWHIAWSRDGKRLASVGRDKKAFVWEMKVSFGLAAGVVSLNHLFRSSK